LFGWNSSGAAGAGREPFPTAHPSSSPAFPGPYFPLHPFLPYPHRAKAVASKAAKAAKAAASTGRQYPLPGVVALGLLMLVLVRADPHVHTHTRATPTRVSKSHIRACPRPPNPPGGAGAVRGALHPCLRGHVLLAVHRAAEPQEVILGENVLRGLAVVVWLGFPAAGAAVRVVVVGIGSLHFPEATCSDIVCVQEAPSQAQQAVWDADRPSFTPSLVCPGTAACTCLTTSGRPTPGCATTRTPTPRQGLWARSTKEG
jgi:hypothetical protein